MMRPLARAQQPYTGITTVLGAPAELPQAPASVAHIAADKRGPQPRCTQCCETVLSARECAPHSRVPRAAICCWVKSNPEYPVPIRLSPGFMHRKLSDLVGLENQKERAATTRRKTWLAAAIP